MSATSPLTRPEAPTTSIDKRKIRFLLLEGIDPSAVATLHAAGYSQIETMAGSPSDDELRRKIADVHFVGIRSRTQLTEEVFQQALKLNPTGIDSLYFWGDYLYRQDKFAEAREALLKAKQAPARPGRELADQGRQGEIDSLLKAVEEELK